VTRPLAARRSSRSSRRQPPQGPEPPQEPPPPWNRPGSSGLTRFDIDDFSFVKLVAAMRFTPPAVRNDATSSRLYELHTQSGSSEPVEVMLVADELLTQPPPAWLQPEVSSYIGRVKASGEQVLILCFSPDVASIRAAHAMLDAHAAFAARGGGAAARPFWCPRSVRAFAGAGADADAPEPPIVPLVGFCYGYNNLPEGAPTRKARMASGGRLPSLFIVQRWVRGNFTQLGFWLASLPTPPPVSAAAEGDADAARRVFVARAACNAVRAVAFLHACRLTLNAFDASSLLLSSWEDSCVRHGADEPAVFVTNLLFSVALPDNAEEADAVLPAPWGVLMRAEASNLGVHIASLVFSALSADGPAPRTSARELCRLFTDVHRHDWRAIRAFCADEPAWTPAVALLDEGAGAGWAVLAALLAARDTGVHERHALLASAAQWRAAVEASAPLV
jgi:hypothetical protein